MLKDITIGQHYPSNSVIHRLDSRIKLIATFVFMVSLFIINTSISCPFRDVVRLGQFFKEDL